MLSAAFYFYFNAVCHSVFMLNVVMLSAVMLSAVAPFVLNKPFQPSVMKL